MPRSTLSTSRARHGGRGGFASVLAATALPALTAAALVAVPGSAHAGAAVTPLDDLAFAPLHGRVVTANSHTPIPGVCILPASTDWWVDVPTTRKGGRIDDKERKAVERVADGGTCEGALTDADGEYDAMAPQFGTQDMIAVDPKGTFVATRIPAGWASSGDAFEADDALMPVGSTLTGTVVDAAGAPVAGVCPVAKQGHLPLSDVEDSRAAVHCSDAAGKWSLAALPQGRWRIQLTGDPAGSDVFVPGVHGAANAGSYRSLAGASRDTGTTRLP